MFEDVFQRFYVSAIIYECLPSENKKSSVVTLSQAFAENEKKRTNNLMNSSPLSFSIDVVKV